MKRSDITALAKKHGWRFYDYQDNIGMVSYRKLIGQSLARINVYLTKMTVGTSLEHPKHGKTQMFRKRVSPKLLEKIFINPRVHTGQGYRRK